MKKLLTILVAWAVVCLLVIPMVSVAAPAGKDTPANDNPNNLYLYEKDGSWDIVWDGAWGKLNLKGNGGAFNGHGLEPCTAYELVKYVDPWPGTGSVSLGTGTSDADGDVHINADLSALVSGDKVWLVLDADFDSGHMVAWNPAGYLLEHNLIP